MAGKLLDDYGHLHEWHYMQSSKPCCLTLVQQTEGSGNGFKLHAKLCTLSALSYTM
jgi:hypothetical protein